ncbi:MAG: preprotein translocase subunit SecA [Candidatus Moranbacteria bacterium RIFOXYB1_FULL_44_23]|nr:MAG: Protein translocase subunit SecA [Candidatus Moranbacteria bacterium GW2011_GWC2_40_12]KKT33914.1 MAG: Protein translocase subunit SecA [Candidatus Moranbacteria bacterium GW2011_GWF2_44_10]OGI34992.1 MAG: preprotein translocase subunit SecA [Candidatus Moranbacteria bacterium RIFOXYC1_FULL_44_8]OGI39555.1 MAG: preprotein translocase subunit SecA [Candidatus Moranbacteria bacterium RIFOXYB1_FULL_44_23]HBU25067.1 preprotein translocase subunit SecA [Candidatus Moranbacteria bacterium]
MILKRLFGGAERQVKKLQPLVEKINELEAAVSKLSDEELKAKTNEFKKRLNPPSGGGEKTDDILPESFSVVREAIKRVDEKRLFDVQLLGGITLHEGKIAEMKTGEGKTHTATTAVYLNALSGKGVHVVTVNDYLAKRDMNWMGPIYHFLGLTCASIQHDASFMYEPKIHDSDEVSIETENLRPVSRREAYAADITYGTNNEFGFDYLRDNMVQSLDQMVQRELNYAIVDEVDSILIDEARTPLIISAPDSESTKLYKRFAQIVPRLKEDEDFTVDQKMRAVSLTEKGIGRVEEMLGIGNIYDISKISYVHQLEQALKANILFKLDRDYVVRDGQVIIVDDFTGRLMPGRRYSEGLHQAIEAKENVEVQKESRTLATITFQNYFRIYKKLSGMTGTALTSAEEFAKVYNLDVVPIPTNVPMIREDHPDMVYKTEDGKFRAVIEEIKRLSGKGQPVLVGTVAIEKSEVLSDMLAKTGVEHEVLNAKNHEREALIIAKAGQRGAVTIATNMAGRGTDIKLGEGVAGLGGLRIIGTERHEARRIDNQLRGRAGRQGDPGASQFYVSLEDELMRRFGGDRVKNIMDRFGLPEDQPIENKIISKSIESAQAKIEGFNFDIRKHVLEYDDVMNKQREVIYKKRKEILTKETLKSEIIGMVEEEIEQIVGLHTAGHAEDWNVGEIKDALGQIFRVDEDSFKRLLELKRSKDHMNDVQKVSAIIEFLKGLAKEAYGKKEQEIKPEIMRQIEKAMYLRAIDTFWMNHLDDVDYLREGIGLRGYGQRDPLVEYKKEAYLLFQNLMAAIRIAVITNIFKVGLLKEEPAPQKNILEEAKYQGAEEQPAQFASDSTLELSSRVSGQTIRNKTEIGRNDPCPCGSGKKYKKCCGA